MPLRHWKLSSRRRQRYTHGVWLAEPPRKDEREHQSRYAERVCWQVQDNPVRYEPVRDSTEEQFRAVWIQNAAGMTLQDNTSYPVSHLFGLSEPTTATVLTSITVGEGRMTMVMMIRWEKSMQKHMSSRSCTPYAQLKAASVDVFEQDSRRDRLEVGQARWWRACQTKRHSEEGWTACITTHNPSPERPVGRPVGSELRWVVCIGS